MKSLKKLLKLSRTQWISVAVLASSLGLAVAVTVPFPTFVGGTAISATQVNQNFAALVTAVTTAETAITTAQAQITALNATVTALNAKLPAFKEVAFSAVAAPAAGVSANMATLTVTAPAAGFLKMNGGGLCQFIGAGGNNYALSLSINTVSATRGADSSGSFLGDVFPPGATLIDVAFSVQGIFPVVAGANTFFLVAQTNSGQVGTCWGRLQGLYSAALLP